MIKFFRKIRQKMLTEKKFNKYLIYAIGEIVLVVVGILIALQINGWNERRKDRVQEIVVLQEIAKTLEVNIELLNGYIAKIERTASSSRVIISVIENKLPYQDTLDRHFHQARVWYSDKFLSSAGYEEFKNAGFDIILSRDLKDKILGLFENTFPQTQETIDIFQGGYWHSMNEYSRNNFYGIYDREFIKPVDFDSLVKDQYYLSTLKEYYNVRLLLLEVLQANFDEIQIVLNLINDELVT
jgi:hypothetical protein